MEKKIIDVLTGDVILASTNTILKTSAIGSCIVIAAYDSHVNAGCLAHVMLPGASKRKSDTLNTKYAADAIMSLLKKMNHLSSESKNIEVCLVGGANVLKRKDDNICQENINSVINLLNQQNISIKAKSLGGFQRRSITLDIEKGQVYYSIGDGKNKLLYSFL